MTDGGATDAVGGGTTGTLNLTQSAIGGSGGSNGRIDRRIRRDASSTLSGDNPSSSIAYNLTANATGGAGGDANSVGGPGGDAIATTNATSATANGSVSASAAAAGGDAGLSE